MSTYIPLETWLKKHKIKKSHITAFVAGLDDDVRELSTILGLDVILVVKESNIKNKKRRSRNSKLKIKSKSD